MRVAERDAIWSRDGVPIEELADPVAPERPILIETGDGLVPRRRRWPLVLYSLTALIFITVLWLVITAPLSRALEPLADPALLLLSEDGHPIALRGAIKEKPVDVSKLYPLTPAAFVPLQDPRFYTHWALTPPAMTLAL